VVTDSYTNHAKNPNFAKEETMSASVSQLDELPYYEQDSGPNIRYQFVVEPGTMGLMSSGRVRAAGPTEKEMDRHAGWDQLYIILGGAGTIVLNEEKYRVAAGHVVRIPRGTLHGVVLAAGEELEYIYVNAFKDEQSLAGLVRTLHP